MNKKIFRLLAWYCAFAPFVQIAAAGWAFSPLGIKVDILTWTQSMAMWALPLTLYFQWFCCYTVDQSPKEPWPARTTVIFLCQACHVFCYCHVVVLGMVARYAPGANSEDVGLWFFISMIACMAGSGVALLLASDMHKKLEPAQ